MLKINNKGQTLAIFVVFIPFIVVLGAFVIDLCYSKYNLNNLNNINQEAIRYGLKHMDSDPKDQVINIIKKNVDDIETYDITTDVENKKINSVLKKKVKSIFGKLLNKEYYEIKSSYSGSIIDEKIVIERND